MKIELAFYLLRHFSSVSIDDVRLYQSIGKSESEINNQISTIGSKFFSKFCNSPFELEVILNQNTPEEIISQKNNRVAFIYSFNSIIGTDSLISKYNLSDFQKKNIKEELRNGYKIKAVPRESHSETKSIVLILDEKSNNWITCFPGRYAPPFPNESMPDKEKKESDDFWAENYFVF